MMDAVTGSLGTVSGILGTTFHFDVALTNKDTGAPEDAKGSLVLKLTDPAGGEHKLEGGEVKHRGEGESGEYFADYIPPEEGLWHYEWISQNSAVAQGDFEVETKRPAGGEPDLTDLRVLVPRARRKIEGPWGNVNNKPPLSDTDVYEMVADGLADILMLGAGLFNHKLVVSRRDPLGGFPTGWKTDTQLEEWEVSVIVAQVALSYFFHALNNFKTSETIKNEGSEWMWELSPGVMKNYLQMVMEERDEALKGLRENRPILDRFASNIRVRDQSTVAILEWWDTNSPALIGGGLPSGQEASVVPAIYPPGIEP